MDTIHGESKIEEEVIENYEYMPKTPPNDWGWLEVKLPPTAIARLNSYMEDHELTVPANQSLAGNVSDSYYLKDVDDWFFKNYVEFMSHDLNKHFPYDNGGRLGQRNAGKHPYKLDSLWVNYQYQTEFNPSHVHAGVFSFVIFMKIPTHWEEQHALPISSKSNNPRASDFSFEYLNGFGCGRVETYLMSPEWENSMLFFPAELRHQVFPFYNCDKPRITISGNVGYDTDKVIKTEEEIYQDGVSQGRISWKK